MLPLEPLKWDLKDPLNNFFLKSWSGLFILIALAAIILLYTLCQTGDQHENQFPDTIQTAEINLAYGLEGTIAAETDSIPRNFKSVQDRADPVFRATFIVRDPKNMLRAGMQAEVLLEQH